MAFCQCSPVLALSVEQENVISDHCETIRDSLKTVQKQDARARVYLGAYYETILTKFIMPLNVRLVENSLSSAGLVENQNDFAKRKKGFVDDYISYQQGLEELVLMDCREEPTRFYEKLEIVRGKRKVVNQDVLKLRSLMSAHLKMAKTLESEL